MGQTGWRDLAASGDGCTIEARDGDARGWSPIGDDASGWTLRGARRALRAYVADLPHEDVADLFRIVRRGVEVERYSACDLGRGAS